MRSAVTTVVAEAGAAKQIAAAAASKMRFMERETPPLDVDHAAERGEHAFVHHFRQGRMGEDGPDEILLDQLGGLADRVTLDQLGHFGADHVRAEELAGPGVEHRLDETLDLA